MLISPQFHLKRKQYDCCSIFWARNQKNVILYLLIMKTPYMVITACANTGISFIHRFLLHTMQYSFSFIFIITIRNHLNKIALHLWVP